MYVIRITEPAHVFKEKVLYLSAPLRTFSLFFLRLSPQHEVPIRSPLRLIREHPAVVLLHLQPLASWLVDDDGAAAVHLKGARGYDRAHRTLNRFKNYLRFA